ATELRSAYEQIHALEARAFSLAERGQMEAAVALLSGAEYDREQRRSAEATSQIARELKSGADAALDVQRSRGRQVVIAVGLAVSLLLFTWIISMQISAGLIARRRYEESERAEQARLAAFVGGVREALTT